MVAALAINLIGLTDGELAELFHQVSISDDMPESVFEALIEEMDRREGQTPEQREIDLLISRGWDYVDAYGEVHNVDPDKLRREQLAAMIDRMPGETLEDAVWRLFEAMVDEQMDAAESAVRGHMFSAAGEAAGIDVRALFAGPAARARKLASEDLLRWWSVNGRVTYTEFKANLLGRDGDQVRANAIRLGANGQDFI